MSDAETKPSPNLVSKKPSGKPASKPAPKVAAKPVAKPAANAAAPAKKVAQPKAIKEVPITKDEKVKKIKMVRDSFTMPKPEFAVLDTLKLRALQLSTPVKKTELIRAGIKALAAMPDADFLAAVRAVPSLKTGRPAKTV